MGREGFSWKSTGCFLEDSIRRDYDNPVSSAEKAKRCWTIGWLCCTNEENRKIAGTIHYLTWMPRDGRTLFLHVRICV